MGMPHARMRQADRDFSQPPTDLFKSMIPPRVLSEGMVSISVTEELIPRNIGEPWKLRILAHG